MGGSQDNDHDVGHSHRGHDHSARDDDGHGHSHSPHGEGEDLIAISSLKEVRTSTAEVNLAEAKANQIKLKRATVFVLVFFVVEVIGGLWSGSLAIISDAAHLLADVSGFILAMVANEIASRPACDKLTYGPVRAEVLSALFSTVLILVLSLFLVVSAIYRIIEFSRGEGEDINGRMMSLIALLGLVVNLVLLRIFGHEHGGHDHSHGHAHGHDGHDDHNHDDDNHGHDHHHGHDDEEKVIQTGATDASGAGERTSLVQGTSASNSGSINPAVVASSTAAAPAAIKKKSQKNINMEAAVLHAITDLVQSVGVLLAGLMIWYDPRWKWADPIATLFFVGLVVHSTRSLLERAFNVLLEGVPDSIDYDRLRNRLSDIEGVTDLHCLHVWSLTLGRTVVSAHIKAMDPEKALASAHEICEDMGVAHSTIQVQMDHCLPESCTHPCVSAVGSCCGPDGSTAGVSP